MREEKILFTFRTILTWGMLFRLALVWDVITNLNPGILKSNHFGIYIKRLLFVQSQQETIGLN